MQHMISVQKCGQDDFGVFASPQTGCLYLYHLNLDIEFDQCVVTVIQAHAEILFLDAFFIQYCIVWFLTLNFKISKRLCFDKSFE